MDSKYLTAIKRGQEQYLADQEQKRIAEAERIRKANEEHEKLLENKKILFKKWIDENMVALIEKLACEGKTQIDIKEIRTNLDPSCSYIDAFVEALHEEGFKIERKSHYVPESTDEGQRFDAYYVHDYILIIPNNV